MAGKTIYKQKFRKEWKLNPHLKDWLEEDKYTRDKAYCSFCKCPCKCKFSDLVSHALTKKHQKAAALVGNKELPGITCIPGQSIDDNENNSFTKKAKARKPKKNNEPESVEIKDVLLNEYFVDTDELLMPNVDEGLTQSMTDENTDLFLQPNQEVSITLQEDRIKAETDYFRQKALYFSKMAENTKAQKILITLQSRKLHLEIQKMLGGLP